MFYTRTLSAKFLRECIGFDKYGNQINLDFNEAFKIALGEAKRFKKNIEIWHTGYDNIERKLTTVIYKP